MRWAQRTVGGIATAAASIRAPSRIQPNRPLVITTVVTSTGPSIRAAASPELKTPWYEPWLPSPARS
ncbi:hypothetical protein ACFQ0T_35635 [Kitasatospora gansuensis]